MGVWIDDLVKVWWGMEMVRVLERVDERGAECSLWDGMILLAEQAVGC